MSNNLKIGDKAWYRGGWGTHDPVRVVIVGIGERNGRVVYDCDNGNWGYTSQFEPFRGGALGIVGRTP